MSEMPVTGAAGQDTQTTGRTPEGALKYGAGLMFDIHHGILAQPRPSMWSGTTPGGRDVIVLPPSDNRGTY